MKTRRAIFMSKVRDDSVPKIILGARSLAIPRQAWDSFHARLNSHYEAWSYKKNKHKKIKVYIKKI